MRAIKIILSVVVVAVLGFFVWKWMIPTPPPPPPQLTPTNQFVESIEKEIDSLRGMPSNLFCYEFFQRIQYNIDEFHAKGFLGETASINDQKEEHLKKNVYAIYSSKFTEQAMFVFNGNEWKTDDLKFIRSENKRLQKSEFLKEGPQKASFIEIDTILAKYDIIVAFIGKCDKFGAPDDELLTEFPNASENVSKANNYLKNKLGNKYVNNCTRLKDGLKEMPRKLFDSHIAYLIQKINMYANQYQNYETQAEYSTNVYTPLRNQINDINYKIYGMEERFVNDKQEELIGLLSKYNRAAMDYFLSKEVNDQSQKIGL